MDTAELDATLVENLAELDAINTQIDRVTDALWAALGRDIGAWAIAKGWNGGSDPDDDFWVAPPDWITEGASERYFYFDHGPGDDRTALSYELSRWCGAGGGRIALWFEPKVGRTRWKPLAKSASQRLAAAGFALSDYGNAYTDCTLQLDVVAKAFREGDLSAVSEPLLQALNKAAAAKRLFDDLISQATR